MDDITASTQEDRDLLEYMMHVQSIYHTGGFHWVGGSLWDDDYDEEDDDSDEK